MNSSPIVIAVIAGIVAALLRISPITGNMFFVLVAFLSPIPIIFVTLGWGWIRGIQAGLVGMVVLLILLPHNTQPVVLHFVFICVLPFIGFSYLIGLSRPIPSENSETTIEWYPLGSILFWITLAAAVSATFVIFSYGTDSASYKAAVFKQLDQLARLSPEINILTMKQKLSFASNLPLGLGLGLFIFFILNFWLGLKLTLEAKKFWRPWPDPRPLGYPNVFVTCFAVGLVVIAVTSGVFRLAAFAFLVPFFLASIILGMAVIHSITKDMELRTPILVAAYASLILIPVAILVAIIGVGEPIFKLKERMLQKPSQD